MANKTKKVGVAMLGEWKYRLALDAVRANGGTEADKEKIFEEYKKIGGKYVEKELNNKDDEYLFDSIGKVDGFIIEVEVSKEVKEAKIKKVKLGGVKKGKK